MWWRDIIQENLPEQLIFSIGYLSVATILVIKDCQQVDGCVDAETIVEKFRDYFLVLHL